MFTVFIYQYGWFVQHETINGDLECSCESNESTERMSKHYWRSADGVDERSEVRCFAGKAILITVTAVTSSSPIRDVQTKVVNEIRPERVPRPSGPGPTVKENQRPAVPFVLVRYTRSVGRQNSVNCWVGGALTQGAPLCEMGKLDYLKILSQRWRGSVDTAEDGNARFPIRPRHKIFDTGGYWSTCMPSYEYRTIEVDSSLMVAGLGGDVEPPIERLNELGADGWDVVAPITDKTGETVSLLLQRET